jgi:AAA+ ATPase superfamily predicted ATPase
MTFINREKELAALEKFWKEDDAQLIVIYGKRRIGKTELIKQFIMFISWPRE